MDFKTYLTYSFVGWTSNCFLIITISKIFYTWNSKCTIIRTSSTLCGLREMLSTVTNAAEYTELWLTMN